MPTLRFANLGPTPGTSEISVMGSLYVLMTEDSTTAIVFDVRRYESHPPGNGHEIKFRRIGDFEIPILPKSRLQPTKSACESCHRPFQNVLGGVRQVYVVNLSGAMPTLIGWRRLRWLFPNADISKVPLGRIDWRPIAEEEMKRSIIRSIESTEFVDRGEKIEIGPFTLFLFRNKKADGSASILVTGEAMGRPFAFFFGDAAFKPFFRSGGLGESEGIMRRPDKLHVLSAGVWHVFYPSLKNLPPAKLPE
jgi:hypothetical protein